MSIYPYQTADPFMYKLLKAYAKENRMNETDAERILWKYLSKDGLGKTFKRQHIIDQYIADFVCLTSKLIVEIDGKYHQSPEQKDSDEIRSLNLSLLGYKVIRFTNEDVICDLEKVLETIKNELEYDK